MSSLQVSYHPKENIMLLYGCINVHKVGNLEQEGFSPSNLLNEELTSHVDINDSPNPLLIFLSNPWNLSKKRDGRSWDCLQLYIIQLISIWTVILRIPWVSKHSSPKQSAKVFQTLQPDELNGWSHQGVRTMISSLAYLKPTLWVEVGIHISATSKNLKAGLLEMWKILGRSPKNRILCLQI